MVGGWSLVEVWSSRGGCSLGGGGGGALSEYHMQQNFCTHESSLEDAMKLNLSHSAPLEIHFPTKMSLQAKNELHSTFQRGVMCAERNMIGFQPKTESLDFGKPRIHAKEYLKRAEWRKFHLQNTFQFGVK